MKNILFCSCGEKWKDVAPFLLRLAVGVTFFMHGYLKMGDIAGFSGFLGSLGVPSPEILGPFVVWLEIIAGLALVLGIFTHWAAKLLAIDMIVAIFLVHWANGFFVGNNGYEFALLLAAASVALVLSGPGRWALDEIIFKNRM